MTIPNANHQERMHAIIEGIVQGVGFRDFVLKNATSLGLTGYVRNTYNGSVEVLAEGESDKLKHLLALIRQGPSLSQVSNVKEDWSSSTGEFRSFRVSFLI